MKPLGKFLHSPLSRVVIVVGLCLLIWTCGDDKVIAPPEDTTQPLKYQSESELLAVYTSGTLRPQEWLVRKIDHELDLIRTTWSDSVPDVNIKFLSPFMGSGVTIRVTPQLLEELKAGTNLEWNDLIAELALNVHFYDWNFNPHYIGLRPANIMHPIRLAEYFVDFPGVEYIHAGGNLQGWEDFYARVPSANGAKYYFKNCTCPELWHAYAYIEVDSDSAHLLGVHSECFESMVNYPTWVSYERFEELIDSLESVKPAWVDTARTAVFGLANGDYFQWSKNSGK